jgi:cell division protein FtsI (penicillin-binding protein 3)
LKGNVADARYVLDELDVPFEWNVSTLYRGGRSAWGNVEMHDANVMFTDADLAPSQDKVPNVKGLGAKDALYLLESCGLSVRLSGKGKVRSQSIQAGSAVRKGQIIYLTLK